jgi:integrase
MSLHPISAGWRIRGYRRSTLKPIRTYLKAALEYAIDEGLTSRNPARKLELSKTRKSRERFYTFVETQRILSVAAGRENLVIRILLFCGLRPAELLALRVEDVGADRLRIDEAVKEKEKGANRIGATKTKTSNVWVAVPPDLAPDLHAWVAAHPQRHDPRAFLFPTATGTAYRMGNFLKRVLKPIAKSAGIEFFDFRAMRSTASTLFQTHGTIKDTQGQMRHADPALLRESDPGKPAASSCRFRALRHKEGAWAAFPGGSGSATDEGLMKGPVS